MALWTFLLLCFYGVHQEVAATHRPNQQECCDDGTLRGHNGEDCSDLPHISPSHTCRIIQEQCCIRTSGGSICAMGIEMAKMYGDCEMPSNVGEPRHTKISKGCCECCLLGLLAWGEGSDCSDDWSYLSSQCAHTARQCCLESSTGGGNPHGHCGGLVCSHLCVDGIECDCYSGYHLLWDGVTCVDIDECLIGNHTCDVTEVCINVDGDFYCETEAICDPGFQRDELNRCEDINECEDDPCIHGFSCLNTYGSFICRRVTVKCGRGYRVSNDGTRCVDVNECELEHVCEHHYCINLVGSYRCQCRAGFTYNIHTKQCHDTNECSPHSQLVCDHICENILGSYYCSCRPGYQLSYDGKSCEDFNECESSPCGQHCINTVGSYGCSCYAGYTLSYIDSRTCEDIDECMYSSYTNFCAYHCVNTVGSFTCSCPPSGYTTGYDGRSCLDIDECLLSMHSCSAHEKCFNTYGGFRCLSFECPENFEQASLGKGGNSFTIRCAKSCHPTDLSCQQYPVHFVTHTFINLPHFRSTGHPLEIAYLRTSVSGKKSAVNAGADVEFSIIVSDVHFSFDVVKRESQGNIVGVVRQLKGIVGPSDVVIEVMLTYKNAGVITHYNIIAIHAFIAEIFF